MPVSAAAAVRAEARRLGADLEERGGRGELDLNIWLPAGSVWVATGGHSLSARYFSEPEAGWAEVLNDVRQGIQRCTDPDCDTCLDR